MSIKRESHQDFEAMDNTTLREFTVPRTENIRTGPIFEFKDQKFELNPSLIKLVQTTLFSGKADEDALAHLQKFLEIDNIINIKNIPRDIILLRLFPFSLTGKAKQWFYTKQEEEINTWEKCSAAFLARFFPISKTNALREKIANFQQQKGETIADAWERLQGYIFDCPHHGIASWLLLQGFYHGLHRESRENLDAAAKGSFMSLEPAKAEELMERISENQGWTQDNNQHNHQIKEAEVYAISNKMETLLKWLNQRAAEKQDRQAIQDNMTSIPSTSLIVNDSSPQGRNLTTIQFR
jgi:hypothetical protein